MKKNLYLLFLLPLLALTGCNNDDNSRKAPVDQLPPPTQSGKYTFGCLVNGEVMIPDDTTSMLAEYQGGMMQIIGEVWHEDFFQTIKIIVLDPIIIGQNYDLTDMSTTRVIYSRKINGSICNYEAEDTFNGWIKFSKIDRTNLIVSGTFEYSTVTENCDTIRVTNGRFDFPYIN